jgi:hypothetical protein
VQKKIVVDLEVIEAALLRMERVRVLLDRIGSREGAGTLTRTEASILLMEVVDREWWCKTFTDCAQPLWNALEAQLGRAETEQIIDRLNEREDQLRKISGV